MTAPQIRELKREELDRVYEIDRSEAIERMYRQSDGVLESYDSDTVMESDHAFWDGHLASWRREMTDGAIAFGAFDGDRMTGFAILKRNLSPAQDQILALYVSAEYRLSGIAKSLYMEAQGAAKRGGATSLYVAATPSSSAVGFYLSQGFEPTPDPHPALLAEQPDDIHMVKQLTKRR